MPPVVPGTAHSYQLLQKKLKKVELVMHKLVMQYREDSSEYRAYQRKQKSYMALLMKKSEYKEQKLNDALDDLHASLHSSGNSISTFDSATSSSNNNNNNNNNDGSSFHSKEDGSSSILSSSETSNLVVVVDYKLVVRKHDKVERILQELRDDHGANQAPQRKDYRKYVTQQKQYLEALGTTEEWPAEQQRRDRRRANKEAARIAKAEAQAEQDRDHDDYRQAVAAAREAQQEELERAKAEALANLRKKRLAMEEKEKAADMAYEQARKAADMLARKESGAMEEDLLKIEEGYNTLLHAQEDLGLIKIGK
jgi:hypothetical protein